jgi:hypothetical protein
MRKFAIAFAALAAFGIAMTQLNRRLARVV